MEYAKLLSDARNYSVVQLPGRQYPGVVIQGDTLHSLVTRLKGLAELPPTDPEHVAEIRDIAELMEEVLHHFENVCREQGIELPYPQRA